jgi:outer membrane protein insertion porin family/translocation and assembly module TamA
MRLALRRCFSVLCILPALSACREDGSGVKVADLSFEGVHAVSKQQLASVLATTESSRLPWGEQRYFSREQFEADLQRIQAYYADRGYPDARVVSYDVRLSGDQTSVRVTLTIEEGEPVLVERIVLEGFQPLPDDVEGSLESRLPLKLGKVLDRSLLQASREMALDELRDHGYPYASVGVSERAGSADRRRVVVLAADPGPAAVFGPIEISGNRSVDDPIVRRQLWFRPGQVYRHSRLLDSQRRLYALELFQFVNVEPIGLDQKSPQIPTRVTVTEGKHRKVNFLVGYGTEERARGEIDWRHVNFFGGARTAGVLARYSALDRGVRLNLTQPYLFGPGYSMTLSGQSWYTDEPAYRLTTTGGRATVTRRFRTRGGGVQRGPRPTTTLAVTYANEWEDYVISDEALADPTFRDDLIALGLDPRTGTGSGQLSALSADLGRNTTENLLDARHGYVAALHVEQAGRWLHGDFEYVELTAEGRYYVTIGGRAVIAVRGRAGAIDSSGDEEVLVPFFKRYFLGGATNLRGWGRFEVSPLSGSGLPIGGHTFLNFSTELRFPIAGSFGGIVFLDGGNVWTSPWDFNLNDLRYDVGPGLRYNTPIGPIRLDVGYQLNPIPGLLVNGEPQTRRFRIHFSVGHAF